MANLIKLSGDFLIAAVIEIPRGERWRWSAEGSVDSARLVPDLLTFRRCLALQFYRTATALEIAERRFEPAGFAGPLGLQGHSYGARSGRGAFLDANAAGEPAARDRFLTLLAHGGDKSDWSAIGHLGAAQDAGV